MDGRGDVGFDEVFVKTGRCGIEAHSLDKPYMGMARLAVQPDQIAIVTLIDGFPVQYVVVADGGIEGRAYSDVSFYHALR